MKKLIFLLITMMLSAQVYAGTTNYNWIYIPKYPDAESANYPTYMDNFMDDVDTDLWNVQQNKLDKDVTAPGTPTCNTPTTGIETNTDGTAITWLNMTWGSIGDSSLREYEVRVKKDSETSYAYTYTDGLSVRIRPAFAGSTYYFEVRVIDKQGNVGSYCTPVSVVAASDTSAPAIPSGLSLSTGISQDNNGVSYVWLQADWTANSEKDVASYKLRIKEGVGGSYYYSTSNTNTLRFINLKPNITYYVGIKAIDASGNESNYSTDSNSASATDSSAPTAPSSLVVNPGFQIIWLTWTGSSSVDVHKYEIYRSATNNVAGASKVGETPGITYPDDDLPNDATYYYWVRAVDDFGNTSGWSNPDTSGATATTALIHNVDVFADLSALKITSAELKSTNWSTTAGSLYDLDDGTFYLGGSTNPKLSWNGLTLTVKGNISVESGQTFSCTNCVDGTAAQFNYAASGSEGGNASNTDNVGSQAASAVNTGVSRATTGLNSSGQATQLVDTTNLPAISSGASRVVIGNEGIKMFNASSAERVNINTDGTFRFGNSAGDNLYWNGSTLVLTGRATIATEADLASDVSCTDCVADTELTSIIDLGAGGVTVRTNNANNKVQMTSSGLYGYNTSGTKTFEIDAATGNAYFGPAGNQISWDGSVLTVPAAKVTGTLSAATILADNISAGTLTGSTIQTAVPPNPRIALSAGTNEARWYSDATTVIASIGVTSGVDFDVIKVGLTPSVSGDFNGVYADINGGNATPTGIRGRIINSPASKFAYGGYFETSGSGYNIGIFASGAYADVRMHLTRYKNDTIHDTLAFRKIAYGIVGRVQNRSTDGACTILSGSGFTATRNTGAIYHVTYDTAFAATPVVIPSEESTSGIHAIRIFNNTTTGFDLQFASTVDRDFGFTAIVP